MLKFRCHYWEFRALILCMDINITSCYSNLRVTDFKRNNSMDRSQKYFFCKFHISGGLHRFERPEKSYFNHSCGFQEKDKLLVFL